MINEQQIHAMMSEVARQAASHAVNDAFVRLGVNPESPFESQGFFLTLRDVHAALRDPEVKEDINFVRKFRKGFERARTKTLVTLLAFGLTAITTTATAVAGKLWP